MLTAGERLLLGYFDLDPYQSLSSLARHARKQVSTAQRTIAHLREAYGLRVRPFINLLALGFEDVVVYANLAVSRPERQRRVVERLKRADRVSWLSYLVGNHQLAFAFFCEHMSELGTFIEDLSTDDDPSLSSWLVSPRLRYTQYNRKYLLPPGTEVREYHFTPRTIREQIDELDASILWTLSNTDNETNREVARALGEPPATIDRRILRLKERGILCGAIAMLSQEHLGVTVYRFLLTFRALTPRLKGALAAFCKQHPRVVFLIESLGPFTFEIGVEVGRAQEIPLIAQEIQNLCGQALHDIQTYMEVEDLKWSFFPMKEL